MIRTVLVANRGEIAVRVIRACADLGIRSVAVYADGDADALHVRLADEAWALDGRTAAETYLSVEKILDVSRRSGADAVHPGYGFLSERAAAARAVEDAGLVWVGPTSATIELLGDKIAARELARKVGAPLVPGSDGPVPDAAAALAFAEEHGLPLAIKAAHGGGGRGMRVARTLEEVPELFEAARREAEAAFGRGECFVERFLERPRHVEAQVIADDHGNVVVAGTRDCSLQRRNQKLVEEAPAPFLDDAVRARVHQAARDLCAAAGYRGAGTVEFLLGADGTLSFLEVNTRLQVEHPVTEETTGLDLVAEQLRVAGGLPLSVTRDPEPRGHAIELRLNAEDPARGFLPGPGRIDRFDPPGGPGVRVDTGVGSGSTVPGEFDSLFAKVVVWGPSREVALARARRAAAETVVEGVPTVLPFHRAVLADPAFTGPAFAVHTQWIETEMLPAVDPQALAAPVTEPGVVETWVEIDGRRHRVRTPGGIGFGGGLPGGTPSSAPEDQGGEADDGVPVRAAMPGTLVRWLVADGETVADGQPVAVVEAMKMESRLVAEAAGTLAHAAAEGAQLTPENPVAWVSPPTAGAPGTPGT
ncbi:biotin carboxylase N-terminal domain-containing protein [Promicromonospora thailandica]|uniref:biotin carboxylase n=1 Tax=Promicromonospora thailandica TaxID=765201 RepID=A0A9X2G3M9_9MICO|nr:biotin carboxylase N-terminal domain-containing protein [Promicromonospora thailandica]MCP2266470.1 acetyl-CoA/propionyl-CoA carboxylase, biotin carboxylase, biotin carboxyl carrier protein [Promicromonospora thailandica]BFF20158.1 biotin carboxylase N-terminal domain-containing protein [Promicromonospora thailandica]